METPSAKTWLSAAMILFSGVALSASKSVAPDDARRLVRAALPQWALKTGPVYVDPYPVDSDPDFYFFWPIEVIPEGAARSDISPFIA